VNLPAESTFWQKRLWEALICVSCAQCSVKQTGRF